MIAGCFRHIRGIGPSADRAIRERGLHSWDDCLADPGTLPFGKERRETFVQALRESALARERNDISYFTRHVPGDEQWRVLAEYLDRATFFDIETTGLSWYCHHPTVVAAWRGGRMRTFLHGTNLDDFLDLSSESDLLVSFNGNCFDVPFLERAFNVPDLGAPHVDLRWIAYHAGLRRGLKIIERELGVRRPRQVADIDGFMSVILYEKWQAGDLNARNRLVQYCRCDVAATLLSAERLVSRYCDGIGLTVQEEVFREALCLDDVCFGDGPPRSDIHEKFSSTGRHFNEFRRHWKSS